MGSLPRGLYSSFKTICQGFTQVPQPVGSCIFQPKEAANVRLCARVDCITPILARELAMPGNAKTQQKNPRSYTENNIQELSPFPSPQYSNYKHFGTEKKSEVDSANAGTDTPRVIEPPEKRGKSSHTHHDSVCPLLRGVLVEDEHADDRKGHLVQGTHDTVGGRRGHAHAPERGHGHDGTHEHHQHKPQLRHLCWGGGYLWGFF